MTIKKALAIMKKNFPELPPHQLRLRAEQHILLTEQKRLRTRLDRVRAQFVKRYGREELESFDPSSGWNGIFVN
jgi:hypothetical protein